MKQQLHLIVAMVKRLALMLVLLSIVVPAMAQENFYAVYNPTTTTLTFKKCAAQADDGNTYYSLDAYLADPSNQNRTWAECKNSATKVVIEESFRQCELTSCVHFFLEFQKLKAIEGLANLNTSKVETMYCMFNNCGRLSSLDLTGFDTSNVFSMSYMFQGCWSLSSLDLSGFNTSNLIVMNEMFSGCSSLTSLNLKGFNTSKIKDMRFLFYDCSSLSSLDLTSFDTSKVTDMNSMFKNCSGLVTLDLTSFNTSNVTDMGYLFDMAYSVKSSLKDVYVSEQFKVSEGCSTSSMFRACTKLPGYDWNNKDDGTMANYATGYFKTYYKTGNELHDLYGTDLTVANLTLTDGEGFATCVPFKAESATYSRTLSNRWATLCLPYAVEVEDVQDCDIYSVVESLADGILTVERMESGTVAAGQPVLLRRKGDAEVKVTISAINADVVKAPAVNAENAYNLVGTFVATQVPDDCYTLANNKFWLASSVNTDEKKINGFCAYIQPKTVSSTAPALLTIVERSTTAIDGIEGGSANLLEAATNGQAEIYNAAGVRFGSLQKGLNIIRMGKRTQKVIIK